MPNVLSQTHPEHLAIRPFRISFFPLKITKLLKLSAVVTCNILNAPRPLIILKKPSFGFIK